MTDSNPSDPLAEVRKRNQQHRLEAVKRWVEYIKREPASVWGPQLNAVVNAQVESATEANLDAEHHQRIRTFAAQSAEDDE
ncbi:hypothetical protein [Natronomonas sp. EA1]|uniref:hypothetical protein n=1 Tax=Natronomonas sp. EA1 TaxID=3421655 RepID=UPI003EBDB724